MKINHSSATSNRTPIQIRRLIAQLRHFDDWEREQRIAAALRTSPATIERLSDAPR